jgi:hypothetical protein
MSPFDLDQVMQIFASGQAEEPRDTATFYVCAAALMVWILAAVAVA